MNAVPKKVAQARSPPTLEQLNAEVADLERQLAEIRRFQNAGKNELPRLMVAGDSEAIAQTRDEVARSEARIAELTAQLETAREAVRLAEQRDRSRLSGQTYKAVRQLVASELAALEALEVAVAAFAEAYSAAKDGLNALDVKMRGAGIEPDPLALRAKLQGITDQVLALATNAEFGRLRSLETPDELRRSGAASIAKAAREWQAITLRQVRRALSIPEEAS